MSTSAEQLHAATPSGAVEQMTLGSLDRCSIACPDAGGLPQASSLKPQASLNWILTPRQDLLWLIGGALGGYTLFYLHAGLAWDMVTVWFVWFALLDAPHFFGTFSRTYLDREEMQRRRKLLIGSLAWVIAGPAVVLLSFGLYRAGAQHYMSPYMVMGAFVSLWAYWHVVRQHYGIMALYKRKNADFDSVDQWVDKLLLYVGTLAPFAAFVMRHPDARSDLGFAGDYPTESDGFNWQWGIVTLSIVAVALAAAAFLVRQVVRWRRGQPLNVPKMLFLAAVVPLHALVCYHEAALTAPLIAFAAFVTIFHDFQYHAIVWNYQRNRCHRPGVDPARFGWAARVSRNFPTFMGCAVGMGLAGGYFACTFDIQPGCMPVVRSGGIGLFGEMTMQHLLTAAMLGFVMHHYFVDQFIWRPSKDRQLQEDLRLATAE